MIDERAIGVRWELVRPELDERGRRVWAAAEARSHGRGGIAAAARATGLSRRTIERGLAELDSGERLSAGPGGPAGGGRAGPSGAQPPGRVGVLGVGGPGGPRGCPSALASSP